MMAHAFNPSYLGGGYWEIMVQNSNAKGSQDPISTNKKLGLVMFACHSSYREALIGREA
jgi:hypothetical protein